MRTARASEGITFGANSGAQHGGGDGVMQHRIPRGALIGDYAGGMFTAVGSIERAHPFGGFFILERGNGLEISAGDGIELHGGFVVSDFFDGGGEMDDGIVFAGHGGMHRRCP